MTVTILRRKALLAIGPALLFCTAAVHAQGSLQLDTATGQQYPAAEHAQAVVAISNPVPATVSADAEITQRVAAALDRDGHITGYVEVSTYGGVVRLRGTVHSTAMIYRAIEIARAVDGVRRINDDALISS